MANNSIAGDKHFDIYLITCIVTGKLYVGLTSKGVVSRWAKGHLKAAAKKGSSTVLSRAIRKYGKDHFTLKVIDTAGSFEGAKSKEIAWIAKLNTVAPNGLNSTLGGEGLSSCIPQVLQKIQDSITALWGDVAYRARHKAAMKEAVSKPSYKAARKDVAEAMWQRDEYREKQKKAFDRSSEQRSASAKKMWEREDYRAAQQSSLRSEKGRIAALKRWHPKEWEKQHGPH